MESLPVHEDIKLGRPRRDAMVDTYCHNLALLGDLGIDLVVYNFMPLFDWFRTDLAMALPDESTVLAYDHDAIDDDADPWADDWPAYFPLDDPPDELAAAYRDLGEDGLRANLVAFLDRVVPAAEEAGVSLGIHPDDPPWTIFDIPRIVKHRNDLAFVLDAVDRPANGLTLCVGSLGAEPENDPAALAREFHDRVHFVHARNVRHTGYRRFHESAHPPEYGDVDLVEMLRVLHECGWSGPIRPDHGRMIWNESGRPGYGLFDRALGASFLNGVWHGLVAGSRQSDVHSRPRDARQAGPL